MNLIEGTLRNHLQQSRCKYLHSVKSQSSLNCWKTVRFFPQSPQYILVWPTAPMQADCCLHIQNDKIFNNVDIDTKQKVI